MEPLNEFYSTSALGSKPTNQYQLENLGFERVTMSFGKTIRDGYGGKAYQSTDIKECVKPEDYDGALALKIVGVKPPYELDKLINYHLDYYIRKGGSSDKFIKHIQYVVLPYIQKWYEKEKPHIELVQQWIEDNKKAKHTMIEYTDLTDDEKTAINSFIESIPARFHNGLYAFTPDELDKHITGKGENQYQRILNFLLTNDFIKLWSHEPNYEFIVEGKKLLKHGSIEKYYEKTTQQLTQGTTHIVGHGNIVTTAGGNVTQTGITININQEDYRKLKELGVDDSKIEELKRMVEAGKSDKSSFVRNCMKWLGDVSKQVVAKGLVENISGINEVIANLIS